MRVPAPPHGKVCPALALALATLAAAPAASLATTITVNFAGDTVANDGRCSLREAVTAANLHAPLYAPAGNCAAGNGNDTILLPAGTFRLMIPGAGEDKNATGGMKGNAARAAFRIVR